MITRSSNVLHRLRPVTSGPKDVILRIRLDLIQEYRERGRAVGRPTPHPSRLGRADLPVVPLRHVGCFGAALAITTQHFSSAGDTSSSYTWEEGPMVLNPATGASFRSSIAPWLSVRKSAQAVDFYKSAFGAAEVYRVEGAEGDVVARLSIDGAEFWLSEEAPEHGNFSPESSGGGAIRMILTVPDPDVVFAAALKAGASEVYPVSEGHGWRVGRVVDPFGHHWEIGRPLVAQ